MGGLALLLAVSGASAAEPAPFHGSRPVVAIRMEAETNNSAATLDVFRIGHDNRAPRLVVRRLSLLSGRTVKTQWADSTTCPALTPRLKSVSTLQMRFVSPVPPFIGRPMALDGTYVTLRAAGETDPASPEVDLTVGGNFGPWVDWAEQTDRELEPCYSGTEPAVTTGG